MNAARSPVLTGVRRHAIDRAPNEIAETPLRAHQPQQGRDARITDAGWLMRGTERRALKRGASITMARHGIASRTAQK